MNVHKSSLYLLLASMCFYLVKIVGSFSPIYIIYISVFLFSLFTLSIRIHLKLTMDVIIVLVTLVYVIVLFILSVIIFKIIQPTYINYMIAGWGYIYVRTIAINFSLRELVKIFYNGLLVGIFLLFIETMYRISHPVTFSERPGFIIRISKYAPGDWFYKYKMNSLLFQDSNVTGNCIIIILFSIYFLWRNQLISKLQYRNITLICILLLVLTFSRAAYVSTIIGYGVCYVNRMRTSLRIAIYLFAMISLFLSLSFILAFNDGSFISKFEILHEIVSLIINRSSFVQIMFGYFDDPVNLIGRFTHLFFVSVYFYTGMIGMILFITFFIVYLYCYTSIVIIPFFIIGLSFIMYIGVPFIYVPFAFIASILEKIESSKHESSICHKIFK